MFKMPNFNLNHMEIFFENNEATSLTFSGGKLNIKETSSLSGYGVREVVDGRLGFAYCQEEGELNSAKEKAKNLAKFSVKSNFSFAPKANFQKPDIFDSNLDPCDYETLKELLDGAKEGAEAFGGKSKIIISAGRTNVDLHNSEGFEGKYGKTDFSLYAECMQGEAFGMSYLLSNKLPEKS
jgi:predicted Zn-dependent protease